MMRILHFFNVLLLVNAHQPFMKFGMLEVFVFLYVNFFYVARYWFVINAYQILTETTNVYEEKLNGCRR